MIARWRRLYHRINLVLEGFVTGLWKKSALNGHQRSILCR